MDQRPRFPITREDFACKPTFKGTLSKLVKKRKLNYAHTRKSLPVASSKELVLSLGKMNLHCVSEKNVTLFTFTITSSDVGRFS